LVHDDMMRCRADRFRRRDVLRLAGQAGLAGLAAGLGVTGCGTGGALPAPPLLVTSPVARYWARQRRHGHVDFANWPYYIDAGHQTLREFTAVTGITVTYAEVITDDASWFAKIGPILGSRESIGYDVMVVTDGFQFSELVTRGELIPLDQSRMTHFYAYASPRFTHRPFDPGNTYSMPWASGATGIAWNPAYVKTPVTSISELWNPAYKGRVGMLADLQDLGNFGMIKLGIDPETSTPADWRAAAKVLTQQRDAGLVRGYYQQSYLDALARGETWISMAWSGDVLQQNVSSGTDLQFVIPAEGGSIWTDNMVIPRYAHNPVDAMMLMDWYYRPPVAATLTESITYVPAVPAVQPIIGHDAARARGNSRRRLSQVASSDLIWLTAAEYARLHNYADVSGKLQREYLSVFQPVTTGKLVTAG
jgi:spermidine/putrescine transport system substrate-binding protein